MELKNQLSESISLAEERERLDAVCKKLLANKVILAWIMKHCMEEYWEYDVAVPCIRIGQPLCGYFERFLYSLGVCPVNCLKIRVK